jgi:uncharacterized protein (TIRG00374 family)
LSLAGAIRQLIPEPGAKRSWRSLAIRTGFTILFLGAILAWLPVETLLAGMKRVTLVMWLGLFAGSFAAHVVAAGKWRVLLGASGARPGPREVLRAHFSGLFANLCLPTMVGGDVVRAGLLLRHYPGGPLAVGSLADRVLDTAALVVLSSAGALLAPGLLEGIAGPILTVAFVAVIACGLATPLILNRLDTSRLPEALASTTEKVREAVGALLGHPTSALAALILALGIQGSYVLLNVELGRAVGIDVPVAVWFLCWPLAKLAGLLPISLGGLGVREMALAGLLLPFGVPAALAVAQSLVWETTVVALGLAAGALATWLGHWIESPGLSDADAAPARE